MLNMSFKHVPTKIPRALGAIRYNLHKTRQSMLHLEFHAVDGYNFFQTGNKIHEKLFEGDTYYMHQLVKPHLFALNLGP